MTFIRLQLTASAHWSMSLLSHFWHSEEERRFCTLTTITIKVHVTITDRMSMQGYMQGSCDYASHKYQASSCSGAVNAAVYISCTISMLGHHIHQFGSVQVGDL